MIEALIDAHASDAELHELLTTEVPHGADGSRALTTRLRSAFRLAISSRPGERHTEADLERILFVVPLIVEALAHGAALSRPPQLSPAAVKEEAVRAVLAYLRL